MISNCMFNGTQFVICSYKTLIRDYEKAEEMSKAESTEDSERTCSESSRDESEEEYTEKSESTCAGSSSSESEEEEDKKLPSLLRTKWHRVVLDEGHVIKQGYSLRLKAACSLKTERRWILTATPYMDYKQSWGDKVNSYDGIIAYLVWMKVETFASETWDWCQDFAKKVEKADESALAVHKHLCETFIIEHTSSSTQRMSWDLILASRLSSRSEL
jgi:hypothetical protein